MPCIKVVVDMEDNGIALDSSFSKELSNKYHSLLDEARDKYYSCLDEYTNRINNYRKINKAASKLSDPINYASPTQLAILLYDIIGVKPVDKDSPRGTGEDILNKIDLPICKAILKCREYEKLLGTYIDKLPELVNPKTGKLHTVFNQCGTVTGRFSSNSPNFQNIPSHNQDIRKMFVADDGYVLVGSDYSQQEPRTLASICEDENLIQAYKDGKDIYAWIASMVYKVPYEECKEFNPDGSKNPEGKKRRSRMKAIVLGIMYSKGSASIATDLGISKKEADNIFNTFFEEFPSIKRFIETSQQYAIEYGYVTTLWGRKRRLPDIQLPKYDFKLIEGVNEDPLDFSGVEDLTVDQFTVDKYTKQLDRCFYYEDTLSLVSKAREEGINIKVNTMKIEDARRQCVNSIIQGSAADMVKLALISIYNDKQLKDNGFKLIMTVHDEIIGQCPIENAKKVSERLSQVMIESALERVSVPMKCDAEITKRWTGEGIEC
jgi:DNA polymerase I-like protein with 3'-5' exonuclease and polymerase domains